MDVFVITSSIVLSTTRRLGVHRKPAMTDFGKLEAINAISRSYEHPFPVPGAL